MMTVTAAAARKACQIAEAEHKPKRLRVGVRGGGCSGLSYFYEFDTTLRKGDVVWEVEGLECVSDPKSLTFLEGCSLDFDSHLLKGGFRFVNPLAKRSCSCGESFAL